MKRRELYPSLSCFSFCKFESQNDQSIGRSAGRLVGRKYRVQIACWACGQQLVHINEMNKSIFCLCNVGGNLFDLYWSYGHCSHKLNYSNIKMCVYFFILVTKEGSAGTSSVGGTKLFLCHRFHAPPIYIAQLLTLHQHRANSHGQSNLADLIVSSSIQTILE